MHSDKNHKDGQDEKESSPIPSSSQNPPESEPLVLLLNEENVKKLNKEYEEAAGSLKKFSMQEYIQDIYFSKMEMFTSSDITPVNISEDRDPGVSLQTPQWEEEETLEQEFWTVLPTHFQDGSTLSSSESKKSSVFTESSFVSSESKKDSAQDDRRPSYVTTQTQTEWSLSDKSTSSVERGRGRRTVTASSKDDSSQKGAKVEKVWSSGSRKDEKSFYSSTLKDVNQAEKQGKQTHPPIPGQRSSNGQPKRSMAQETHKKKDHMFEESTANGVTAKDLSQAVQGSQESVTLNRVERLSQKIEASASEGTVKDTSRQAQSQTPTLKKPKRAKEEEQENVSHKGMKQASQKIEASASEGTVKDTSRQAQFQTPTLKKPKRAKEEEQENVSHKGMKQASQKIEASASGGTVKDTSRQAQSRTPTLKKSKTVEEEEQENGVKQASQKTKVTASGSTEDDIGMQAQSPTPTLKKPKRGEEEMENVRRKGVKQASQKSETTVDGGTAQDTLRRASSLTPTLKKRAEKQDQKSAQWKGAESESKMTEASAIGRKVKDMPLTTILKKSTRPAKNLKEEREFQEDSKLAAQKLGKPLERDISKQSHPSVMNLKKYKRSIKKLQENQVLEEVNSQSVQQLSDSFSHSKGNQQQPDHFLKIKRSLKRLQNTYEPQQLTQLEKRGIGETHSGEEMKDAHGKKLSERFKRTSKGHVSTFKAAVHKSIYVMAFRREHKISFRLSEAKELFSTLPVEEEEPDDLFMSVAIIQTKYLKNSNEAVCKFYPSGKIFYIFFPDGSGQVHYPSGNVAIIIICIASNYIAYIILEDQAVKQQIQAVFQSDGHATCYQQNKLLWVNLKPTGGYYFDKDAKTIKRWSWWDFQQHIHAPPLQSINMNLNANIRIRIKSQDRIYLVFSEKENVVGFNIGAKLTLRDPKISERPKVQICKIEHYLHLQNTSIHKLLQQIQNVLKHPTRLLVETLRIQDLIAQFQLAKRKRANHNIKKYDSLTSVQQIPSQSNTTKPYSTYK
uniref:Glutamate-rich protein 6B isoform X2 n=1 Tax=Geotrypetes seraphini TaxID=260995 RepID=A0A6P8RM63_GEOSA|nr:glutamate-rich protein 6B isoform X2 [Geotrypetes seraphini]